MGYTNSMLATYKRISQNRTSPRNHAIDRITPHCFVGQASAADMCAWLCSPSAQASANYVIGKDGQIGLNVKEQDRAWTSSSRENDNRAVTIECASDKTDPYKINGEVYNSLINLCVDICRRNGKTKLLWLGDKDRTLNYNPDPNEMLLSVHRWFANKACPGDYIYNRLGTISETVTKQLGGEIHWFRVRKSWDDAKSQLGAYEILQNAKDNCPIGYSVFDDTGKAVYTPTDANSGAQPSKYPSGVPASKEAYIESVGTICRELQKETGILAEVVTAQCCLETGFGLDPSCKVLMDVNNLLGMKTDLINGTWKDHTVWNGKYISKQTPEYHNGQLVYVKDYFRSYDNYYQCILDYEQFLLHVRNDKGYKYACIAGMTDPAAVIRRIRIGTGTPEHPEGYCTDPNYEQKILKIIMDNDLTRFDGVVKDIYAVRRDFDDIKYQLGLFHVLDNAKKVADENWGYKVYNTDTKELVYQPMLKEVEKYVSTLVWMDQLVRDDIAAEKYWSYQNKNTQELSKTFDAARKTGNRHTNCVTGVQWGMLKAGICERDGIQWYGNGKIVWLNSHARQDAEKYFQIIDVYDKTLKKCINGHLIQLGDTITYTDMAHTNVYIGNKQSYDTGHAYCTGSGEGAFFKKWIGDTPYMSHKVAQILRPYDKWRVQCGVFTVKKNASALVTKLKKAGFDAMIVTEGKNYIVQAGWFYYKDNAVRLCEKIKASGFDCLVKGIPC